MPALDAATVDRWRDLVVVDRDGVTIGTITAFYLDRVSRLPQWALVHTGWFGDRRTFLPLRDALEADGEIRVPYGKALIRQAPALEPRGELTADEERILAGHYGLHDLRGAVAEPGADPARDRDRGGGLGWGLFTRTDAGQPPADAAAQGGPPEMPDEAGVTVTRSEEELRVGVRTRLRRLRLRKYVVTEYVTRTIPVRREEVRLEELPPDPPGTRAAAPAAERGGAGSEARLPELILHREEPVIQLRVVPVERVRVIKRVLGGQRTIAEEVRKEHIEVRRRPPDPTT